MCLASCRLDLGKFFPILIYGYGELWLSRLEMMERALNWSRKAMSSFNLFFLSGIIL